nr:uncharacterized protein LOC109192716 [Ipomoea trifida]
MTQGGGRAGRIRGRGRGALDTPPIVEPIVAPPLTVVPPPVVSPTSIGSLVDLPIWDESIEAQVRKAFIALADLRYAYMVSKFKAKLTLTGRATCVAEETWTIWEAYWDRPDVKVKS